MKINQKAIRIVTNLNCNKRCDFCYQNKFSSEFYTIKKFKEFIKEIENPNDITNITIMGGEPFLNSDIFKIIIKARNTFKNALINIDSNGILLDEHKLNYLERIFKKKGKGRLSLDFATSSNLKSKYEDYINQSRLRRLLNLKDWSFGLKFNFVYSKLNENSFFHDFKFALMFKLPKKEALITVCTDFINKPRLSFKELFSDYIINITEIKEIGLSIFQLTSFNNKYNVGNFEVENFDNTDFIIYPDGKTYFNKFSEFLKIVR